MLRNFIKIAWRNLYKKKLFSFIHIIGLTIGITVCMMIFLYIMNEFSVDRFHKQGKNIYRVMRQFDATKNMVPYLSGPYGPALLNDYPNQIQEAVRVMPNSGLITLKNNTSFNEKKVYIADSGFFNLFSFPLVKGNPSTALKDPLSIVISQTTAKKYFGNEDPMGKVVTLDQDWQLKVTGVFKDIPSNTHLDFDMVIPITNYENTDWFKVWRNNNEFVYARIDNPADVAALEKQFPAFMQKYMGADMAKMGAKFDLFLR
ncbi:MAG: ABC transporter permease, partial [Sphingobacteriaceae bacterium]